MRVLVTGAGGFVGHHLIADLGHAGHEVVACSLHAFEAEAASAIEAFDLRDAEATGAVIGRHEPDAVIHLAAQASVPRSWEAPAETYEINVVGTSNLLEGVRNRPETRVLLVGSAQVYGSAGSNRPLTESDPLHPPSPYAVSKAAGELIGMLYHRELGVSVLAARPFNHTGPGQGEGYAVGHFCAQITDISRGRNPLMRVGRLDSRRDFLDVRDVVAAYRLLIEGGDGGEVYNVASGEAVLIGDLLKILLDVAGLSGRVEVVEEAPPRAGDPQILVGDSSKIREAVGWRPEIPIEISLADTLAWYESRP
ncbi:MAG: GDP-mannose 4,6-dehydratase [Actinomycetota bacterium]